MSETRNVKVGVCKVFFDGVDLGYTQGGVEFSVSTMTHKVEVDQFGKTVINESIIGRECKVMTPFAETTLQNFNALFPSLAFGLEGTTAQRLGVDTAIGVSLLDTAKLMVIHPYGNKDFDFSDEILIPLCNTPGSLQYSYALEKERIFNTEFNGYPDPVSGVLFYSGNPFTDLAGKTFSFTSLAGTTLTVAGATAALTGKMAMLGSIDATSTLGAGLLARKLYYVKFVSATAVSLHKTAAEAIAGTGAIATTTASAGSGLRLAILN